MARYRVAVEEYQYYGVYVEADSPEEAEEIVQNMIDGEEDIDYDDEGEGDTRVVEGEAYEIDENGDYI